MATRQKAKCIVCGKGCKNWQTLKNHYRVSAKCGQELRARCEKALQAYQETEVPVEEIARRVGINPSMMRREIKKEGLWRRPKGPTAGHTGRSHEVVGLPTTPEPPKRSYTRRKSNGRGLNFCPNCGQDLAGWR